MICKKCNRDLPDEFFYFRKNVGRYESMCKECVRKYQKEHRRKNIEKVRAYWRDYWYQRRNINIITEINKAKFVLGGCKCYIQNHAKTGEYHFNIVTTDGEVLKTNSFSDFLSFINKYKNLG